MGRASIIAGAVIAIGLVSGQPARADLAPNVAAAVQLRVLSFDRALAKRSGESILIGVVFKPGSDSSEKSASDIVDAFESLAERERIRVFGKTITAVAVALDKQVAKSVADEGVDVVYLADVPDDAVETAIAAVSATGLPTLCGREAYVAGGLSVAVVPRQGKPSVLVNTEAAARAGMDLSPRLLRLAERVE